MNERELWLECVGYCINNEIHEFHLMFDEFLKMRDEKGFRLVPIDSIEFIVDCADSHIWDRCIGDESAEVHYHIDRLMPDD